MDGKHEMLALDELLERVRAKFENHEWVKCPRCEIEYWGLTEKMICLGCDEKEKQQKKAALIKKPFNDVEAILLDDPGYWPMES